MKYKLATIITSIVLAQAFSINLQAKTEEECKAECEKCLKDASDLGCVLKVFIREVCEAYQQCYKARDRCLANAS